MARATFEIQVLYDIDYNSASNMLWEIQEAIEELDKQGILSGWGFKITVIEDETTPALWEHKFKEV